jgi:hypothetical protein
MRTADPTITSPTPAQVLTSSPCLISPISPISSRLVTPYPITSPHLTSDPIPSQLTLTGVDEVIVGSAVRIAVLTLSSAACGHRRANYQTHLWYCSRSPPEEFNKSVIVSSNFDSTTTADKFRATAHQHDYRRCTIDSTCFVCNY